MSIAGLGFLDFDGRAIIKKDKKNIIIELYHLLDCTFLGRMRVELLDFNISGEYIEKVKNGETTLKPLLRVCVSGE